MSNYTPRVYVACLASYNDGILHGEWVDAVDADEIQEGIDRVLFSSPRPNVTRCRRCKATRSHDGTWPRDCTEEGRAAAVSDGRNLEPFRNASAHDPAASSEEHAFHDYDGFGAAAPGEYASVSDVAQMGALIQEHDGLAIALLDGHASNADEARTMLNDQYRGAWDSLEDYATEYLEDTGAFQGAPELLRNYFDYEKFARDLELGGDVFTVRHEGKVHVFDNH